MESLSTNFCCRARVDHLFGRFPPGPLNYGAALHSPSRASYSSATAHHSLPRSFTALHNTQRLQKPSTTRVPLFYALHVPLTTTLQGNWVNMEKQEARYGTVECCKCNEQSVDDPEFDDRCLKDVTRDETMIPVDMAVAYQFDVDEFGIPSGCPGFPAGWTRDNLIEQAREVADHGISFYRTEPQCAPNDMRDDEGGQTMRELVEFYADDLNAWVADFHAAWVKMLSNGYPDGLTPGPDVLGVGRLSCERKKRLFSCEV